MTTTTTNKKIVLDNNKQWSPILSSYEDFHITLPLTCRFLALVPQQRIPPVLYSIFGDSICKNGNSQRNDLYIREARDVAAQFPSITVFTDTIADKITRQINKQVLRPVAFVLGLLSVSGRSELTSEDNAVLVAIRLQLNKMDDNNIHESLLQVILRLVEWEWKDRSKLALSVLDAGFMFNKSQARVIWLTMALCDVDFVRRGVIVKLKQVYGFYQSVEDTLKLTVAAPYDFAVFMMMLQDIEYPSRCIRTKTMGHSS
jgi:hypothetical protein